MIQYGWNSMNGAVMDTYTAPTVPIPANYIIPYISVTYNAAGTSATLTITPPTTTPGSYGGSATSPSRTFNDPDFIIATNTTTYTINGLTPGQTYSLRVRAWSGANQTGTYGDYYYDKLIAPQPASTINVKSTTSSTQVPLDTESIAYKLSQQQAAGTSTVPTGTSVAISGFRDVQTSLFSITNTSIDKNKYSVAVKNTGISTAYSYYSFGTSLFFESLKENVSGSGGLGFFTSNNGLTGYYIMIQTSSNLSDTADKEIKIVKVINGKKIVLNDNQGGSSTQLTGILGGQIYKLDVNVLTTATSRTIEVYINNFKITATDKNATSPKSDLERVLPITDGIAMCSASGRVSFDYIYATPLTEQQYKEGIVQSVYEGKYGIKTLNFLYGDKILSSKSISSNQLPFLEEFGTVARELKKIKIKYESRPGIPLYTSTGINKYVNILGQRLTSYGAEIYIINNSGTFVPLDDSELYSFSVVGNYIVVSGQHEYVSNTLSENTIPEPAIFESSWIQSEADAKNLTTWIQDQWSKKQQVIDMEVFSNPLISVGDIISVNYPSNGFDGTQKFVVTKVGNSFGEGLSTTITARSIYS